jgi:IS5 family transposase
MKQMSFCTPGYNKKKGKGTRREQFLTQMEQVVPWSRLIALIAPHYPKGAQGRKPLPLERMLRIYCLQQWYALSDPAMEEELYDSQSMRSFVGISGGQDIIPDESSILHFRHLLERHELTQAILAEVNAYLGEKGLLMSRGTIVDATIIHAPTSTKNAQEERDPEMHQTRKGKQWYFGMKAHIGVDADSGLTHSVVCTPANVADNAVMGELVHGGEHSLWGDAGYAGEQLQQMAEQAGFEWNVQERGHRHQPLTEEQKRRNREKSRVRARVEHAFHVVKCLWGHVKVRYRGLAKNAAQMYALFALANLYKMRHQLAAA